MATSSPSGVLVFALLLFFAGECRAAASPNILCVIWSSLLQELGRGTALNGFSAATLDDAGPCTHLMFMSRGLESALVSEFHNEPMSADEVEAMEAYFTKGAELKRQRPELKLMLSTDIYAGVVPTEEERKKFANYTVEFLKRHNVDGVLVQCHSTELNDTEMWETCFQLTTETCAELHKNNLTLSLFLWNGKTNPYSAEELSAMVGCSEFIVPETNWRREESTNHTGLLNPLLTENSTLQWYLDQGIPREKLAVVFPLTAYTYKLKDPEESGIGAAVVGPGPEKRCSGAFAPGQLPSSKMMEKLKKPEEGWVVRRDELTDTPYAVSANGVWATYEDATSFRTKARFLRNFGISNAVVMTMELDDYHGGEGGVGRFPMIHALKESLQSDN